MPLDEARLVTWPFDTRQPMGMMLDQGTLTRSKLQWAAEKAKWPDVRRAAQTLIEELERQLAPTIAAPKPASTSDTHQPADSNPFALPRYGARVVLASEYLEEQERLHGWLLAYYIGLGVGAAALTINTIFWLLRGQALWLTNLSIVGNVAAWIWFIGVIRRQIEKVRTFRAGRKGEEHVVEALRTALDSRWTIYRNLQLPDRKSDLDLILVGPGGVWAVQIKATAAPLRVHEGRWQVRRGGRWVAAKPDPGAQVTQQATALNDFFKRQGIARFVERAIALAEPQPFDQFTASEIPVWLPFDLDRRAQALVTRHPPQSAELAGINELLGQRAVEQRAVEGAEKKRQGS